MPRALGPAFFVTGLVGLAWASRGALQSQAVLPPWPALAMAALTAGVGLMAAALAWVTLLAGTSPRRRLVQGFVAAQLGKYIPGGVWLAAGQIGFAHQAGIPLPRAAGALGACAVAMVAAGGAGVGILALILAATGTPATGGWILAVPALALILLLDRRWMGWAVGRLGRWKRMPAEGTIVPAQRAILSAFVSLLLSLLAMALAYALLFRSLGGDVSMVRGMSIFLVAWLAGFLAVGVPSGIGAREAALVALMPEPAGIVLAASVAHRVVQMAAEAAVFLATREWRTLLARARARLRRVLPALPNVLSASRVALVPVLWILALRGEAHWLGAGLLAAGLTDLLDGPLARRLHATSRFGAQLDSLGDNLIALSGVAWLMLLRPDVAVAFLTPLAALLALYLAFLGVGWVKFRRFGNLHLYSAKLSAVLLYAFLLHCLWFPGAPVVLFYLMWTATAASLLEGLVYQLVSGEVDEDAGSVFRALRFRRVGRQRSGRVGHGRTARVGRHERSPERVA